MLIKSEKGKKKEKKERKKRKKGKQGKKGNRRGGNSEKRVTCVSEYYEKLYRKVMLCV